MISSIQQNKRAQAWIYAIVLILLLCVAGYLLCANLSKRPLTDWDEARHAVNAYEMVQSGDYIVHTYLGETDLWNLKPPLSYWMIAIGYKIFGYTALAIRAYSVAFMFATMVMLTLWTKKRYGALASIAVLLLLLANRAIYDNLFARFGDADAMMIFFYTAGMLFMIDSGKNMRKLYGSAVCFGLSFMLRSWHAAMIPLTCFAFLVCTGRLKQLKLKNYLLLLLFGLLPILPWAIARFARDGFTFFVQSFLVDVYTRSTTNLEDHGAPYYTYAKILMDNPGTLWAGLFCLIGLGNKLLGKKPLSSPQMGALLWVLLPIVLYSIPISKNLKYCFPAMIGLALAGGISVSLLGKLPKRYGIRAAALAAAGLWLCVLIAGNIDFIANTKSVSGYRKSIQDALDRDYHSDMPVYIQHTAEDTEWRQAEVLYAMLQGDVVCKDGGVSAFEEEEEDALLIVEKMDFDEDLLNYYPVYYEDSNVYILEN